jgi:hypothetical protein
LNPVSYKGSDRKLSKWVRFNIRIVVYNFPHLPLCDKWMVLVCDENVQGKMKMPQNSPVAPPGPGSRRALHAESGLGATGIDGPVKSGFTPRSSRLWEWGQLPYRQDTALTTLNSPLSSNQLATNTAPPSYTRQLSTLPAKTHPHQFHHHKSQRLPLPSLLLNPPSNDDIIALLSLVPPSTSSK